MSRTSPVARFRNLAMKTITLDGTLITATAAEINAIAGGGLSATELGFLDGALAGTAVASKAAVLGANKNLDEFHTAALYLGAAAGTAVTATAAEINVLAGSAVSTAELQKLDGLATTAYLPVVEMRSFTQTSAAGTYTGTVTVPAGALILDIKVWSTVLWDAGTSSTMKVGDTDDDGWYTGIDLQATDLLVGEEINFIQTGGKEGVYLVLASGLRSAAYSASSRAVAGIITQVGTGTAGRTFMSVHYVLPTATAATKV